MNKFDDTTTFISTTTRQPMFVLATEKVSGTGLLEAAYGGKVVFSKVRGTGTLRRWPVLAKGSAQRKAAEDIMARRAKKETVEAIAKSLNQSVPTVRRTITSLAFTLELEALNTKAKAALAKKAVANMEAAAKAATPKAEAAKPATPKAADKPKVEAKATTAKPKAPLSEAKKAAAAKRKEAAATQRLANKAATAKAEAAKPEAPKEPAAIEAPASK